MANDTGKLPSKVETIHLKVYIHCEGCRKKVKKILTRMEGVYTVDINPSLGKVTVTGTVDSKSVMKKLEKAGKVVELWPSPQGVGGGGEGRGKNLDSAGGKTPTQTPKEKNKQENKEEKGPSPPAPQGGGEKKDIKEAKPKQEEEGGNKDVKPKCVEIGHMKDGGGSLKGESGKDASPLATKSQNGTPSGHGSPSLKGNVEHGDKKNNNNNNICTNSNTESSTTTTPNKKKKGGGGGNANNSNSVDNTNTKKSNTEVKVEEGDTQVPKAINNNGGGEAPNGTSNGLKKGGRGNEDNALSNGGELFSEAGASSVNTINKNLAPPPMVLVETNEYDYYMETHPQEDYGTHIFSDENANNCSIM